VFFPLLAIFPPVKFWFVMFSFILYYHSFLKNVT